MKLKEIEILLSQTDFKGVFSFLLLKQNQLVIHVEVLIKLRCAKNLISSSKKRIFSVSSYIVNSENFIIIHCFLSRLLHF